MNFRFDYAFATFMAINLIGRGTHSGGLVTVIKNTLDAAVNVTFYQSLPWYLRLQFHSMAMELNGKELNVLECMAEHFLLSLVLIGQFSVQLDRAIS